MLIAHVLRDKGNEVFAIPIYATLEEAARELHQKGVGALVILDSRRSPVGVVSERDIIRAIARRGPGCLDERVDEVMSTRVLTADPLETVDEGLARMTESRVRHLPVLDENQKLVGIVSIGDLVKMRIMAVEAQAAAMHAYIATG
jgi:CBS domain-containing protein